MSKKKGSGILLFYWISLTVINFVVGSHFIYREKYIASISSVIGLLMSICFVYFGIKKWKAAQKPKPRFISRSRDGGITRVYGSLAEWEAATDNMGGVVEVVDD